GAEIPKRRIPKGAGAAARHPDRRRARPWASPRHQEVQLVRANRKLPASLWICALDTPRVAAVPNAMSDSLPKKITFESGLGDTFSLYFGMAGQLGRGQSPSASRTHDIAPLRAWPAAPGYRDSSTASTPTDCASTPPRAAATR